MLDDVLMVFAPTLHPKSSVMLPNHPAGIESELTNQKPREMWANTDRPG